MREKGAQYKRILAGLHYQYIGRAKGLWRMRRHGPVIVQVFPLFLHGQTMILIPITFCME